MEITESMKEALVEQLCSEGWTTGAAWAVAEDADNWQEMQDGSIEANVIAGRDDYSIQEQQDALHPFRS